LQSSLARAATAVGLALLLWADSAEAAPSGPPPQGPWDPLSGLTFGPTFGWVGGGELHSAFAAGAELSYSHVLHTPLALWVTGGFRLWTDGDQTPALPYGEAGLAFGILVAGAGYSAGLNSDDVPAHAVHVFVGLAIPLWSPGAGHILYMEPYYRPAFDVSGEGRETAHELGLMLKWYFALATGDRS
jgi:hypothetical protein